MSGVLDAVARLPWGVVLVLCATLGLAPFAPPHLFEKLSMLAKGTLARPIDWFDLLFHGLPWAVLLLKVVVWVTGRT